MENIITWLKGTTAHQDYIIIAGQPDKELRERIECLLERIADYGFHPTPEKREFL